MPSDNSSTARQGRAGHRRQHRAGAGHGAWRWPRPGARHRRRRPQPGDRDGRRGREPRAASSARSHADLTHHRADRRASSPRRSQRFGRLDILVNNAGMIRRADALEFTETDWDDVMNVNLKSRFLPGPGGGARDDRARARRQDHQHRLDAVLPGRHPRARPIPRARAASRASRACSPTNGRRKGINVNAIAPGYIATNNTEALRHDEVRNREILARIPAGRWGKPDDLSGAAVFLASARPTTSTGRCCRSTEAGWRAEPRGRGKSAARRPPHRRTAAPPHRRTAAPPHRRTAHRRTVASPHRCDGRESLRCNRVFKAFSRRRMQARRARLPKSRFWG